jgi:outer membrane protein
MLKRCIFGLTACLFVFGYSNYVYCAEIPVTQVVKGDRLITISDGVSIVLKDSRLINIEISDKDMSFEDTLIAISPLLPHLSMSMAKTYNQYTPAMIFGAGSVPMGNKDPLSAGIDIYQTLFDFGKSISNYKASTESFHARKAKVESVKRAVTLEFITTYFNLLETEKMIVVAKKEVDSLNAYLNDMSHLYEQGVIVKNDLLPAKVKLADARQKLIASVNRREVAAASLSTILTLPLTEKIIVQDVESEIPQLPGMDDAWSAAEANRPEILFFNSQIKSSTFRESAKTVENLPTIFVNAGYSYAQNKYMVHEDGTYIKLGAKMDLYDGGVTGAEIMKERYLHTKLREQKNKLIDDIRYEVKDSYLGLKDSIEKLNVARGALSQAEENVRFYRVKYNNGVATSTDVLEAINLQTKAQTNYYSADYELKRSYAKLIYSIGSDLTAIYKKMEK